MDAPLELTLCLLQDPHGLRPVPVLSLAWGEARAAFPAPGAPILLIGQTVELGFRAAGIEGLARARGFVCRRVDEHVRRIYDFQLDHADGAELDAVVNRRASVRAAPDPGAPIRVVLHQLPDGPSVQTLLRDVSEGGLSVLIGREQEWILAPAERLGVEMRLPGWAEPLVLPGRVVHRSLERTAIHYGIAFDAAEAGRDHAREAIRAFVVERTRAVRSRQASDSDAA
jgi:hypothetical protein